MKNNLYEIFEIPEGNDSDETSVNVDSLAVLSLMAVIRKETGKTIDPTRFNSILDKEISLGKLNTFLIELEIGWN